MTEQERVEFQTINRAASEGRVIIDRAGIAGTDWHTADGKLWITEGNRVSQRLGGYTPYYVSTVPKHLGQFEVWLFRRHTLTTGYCRAIRLTLLHLSRN